jgi:hypothetical protein
MLAVPREKLGRTCKGKDKATADVKVKTVPPDVKVKPEPKVGDKRKPGGQNGIARGPYKKANVGVVLKGSDAPIVNLVSPDKGTRRPRHAFARILAACSSIEILKFQWNFNTLLPRLRVQLAWTVADSFFHLHSLSLSILCDINHCCQWHILQMRPRPRSSRSS